MLCQYIFRTRAASYCCDNVPRSDRINAPCSDRTPAGTSAATSPESFSRRGCRLWSHPGLIAVPALRVALITMSPRETLERIRGKEKGPRAFRGPRHLGRTVVFSRKPTNRSRQATLMIGRLPPRLQESADANALAVLHSSGRFRATGPAVVFTVRSP